MKTPIAALALSLFTIAGCAEPSPPQAVKMSSNPNVQVELLFTHEGVRVYRFKDGDHTVYYTNAHGSSTEFHEVSDGESSHIERTDVLNLGQKPR